MLSLSCMLIILSAVLSVLVPYLILLDSLLSMSGLWVKMCLLVSLCFSAPLRQFVSDGGFWNVQLDVRDLGGHLDFTFRGRAGTLSKRVGEATVGVASVGALPMGFKVKLGLVRGKHLLAGLHAAEASYVSSSSTSAFRAAIVRAVWSSNMPLANAPAVLNLLDGPVGVDLAFHIIWSRFRMMRRYLAYCPDEEPRIFRMLDLNSRGAQGHGPVHLLLISAADFGFAWDGSEHGWVRVSLPPSRMMTGLIQHFRSAILEA